MMRVRQEKTESREKGIQYRKSVFDDDLRMTDDIHMYARVCVCMPYTGILASSRDIRRRKL